MKYLVRISRKRKPGFRSTIRVVNIDKLRKAEVEERPKVAEKVLMVKITDEGEYSIMIFKFFVTIFFFSKIGYSDRLRGKRRHGSRFKPDRY